MKTRHTNTAFEPIQLFAVCFSIDRLQEQASRCKFLEGRNVGEACRTAHNVLLRLCILRKDLWELANDNDFPKDNQECIYHQVCIFCDIWRLICCLEMIRGERKSQQVSLDALELCAMDVMQHILSTSVSEIAKQSLIKN